MTKNEQLINYIAKKAVTCESNCRIDYKLYERYLTLEKNINCLLMTKD